MQLEAAPYTHNELHYFQQHDPLHLKKSFTEENIIINGPKTIFSTQTSKNELIHNDNEFVLCIMKQRLSS